MTSKRWIYPDGTYARNLNGKEIRVYDWIDNRLTIHDLFTKLSLLWEGCMRIHISDLDIESGWSDAIKNRRNHLEFAAAVL